MGIIVNLLTVKRKNCFMFLILLLIFFFNICQETFAAQTVTFQDDLKRTVKLPHPAVRIVSLSEAHAENIVAIRAVKQLAGVNFSTETKWVFKNIPRMSRVPSFEQIAELNPDLVILDKALTDNDISLLKDLDKEKIKYAVMNRPGNADLYKYMEILGKITGRVRESKQALILSEKNLYKAAVRSQRKTPPRVFVIAGSDFSTCAFDSWGAKLIAASRGNLISDKKAVKIKGYPWFIFWGPQKLAEGGRNIDVIITLVNNERKIASLTRETILNDPRFKNIPAVKSGRVWEMEEADLMLPSLVRMNSSLLKIWQILYRMQ